MPMVLFLLPSIRDSCVKVLLAMQSSSLSEKSKCAKKPSEVQSLMPLIAKVSPGVLEDAIIAAIGRLHARASYTSHGQRPNASLSHSRRGDLLPCRRRESFLNDAINPGEAESVVEVLIFIVIN